MKRSDGARAQSRTRKLSTVLKQNPTLTAILAISVLGLVLRLAFLGDRIAHYDEARVGYWAMHYLETGEFHYRYIIHGPLVQHVDRWLFALVGANDFTMRLPVALIGGLLPASIVLYRERLRDSELIAGALFLALNPILLYYSRFFRSTLPAVAFAFVALGLLVRAADTRRFRYVHGAAVCLALAFAAKENAIVYLLTWAGAGALLLDHTLYRPRGDGSGLSVLQRSWDRYVRGGLLSESGRWYVGQSVLAVLLFLLVVLFFYAPRAGPTNGVGLWKTVLNPGQLPVLIDVTLHGVGGPVQQPGMIEGYDYWLGGGVESGRRHDSIIDRYLTFLGVAFRAIGDYAVPLVALGVIGFVLERYASPTPRNLVMFASYWGIVSLLGFPLGSDIANAWITVNGLVPLAIPAGVGLAYIARWGLDSWEHEYTMSAIVTGLIVLLVVVSMGHGMATGVYTNDQSNENSLVQYAQPADDFRPLLRNMRAASADHDGTDVVFFGSGVVAGEREESLNSVYPACSKMQKTLPMQWYIAIFDAESTCVHSYDLANVSTGDPPPIIITKPVYVRELESYFDRYVERTYHLRTFGPETTFYVAEEYAPKNASGS